MTALFNVFPLPRQRGFRRSFSHAGEAMDRGYSVLIFPEGTRSPDGKMHPFRAGIGLLAQQSRVPVVPVALIGLGEMRAGRTRWFRSGRLEVRVGKAFPIEEGAEPCSTDGKARGERPTASIGRIDFSLLQPPSHNDPAVAGEATVRRRRVAIRYYFRLCAA